MKKIIYSINLTGYFFCFFLLAFFSFQSNGYPAPSSYFDTVQKTYIGYYQRAADPGGLIYWANRLDARAGNLNEIIEAFANEPESQALYGTINSSNISTVVDSIYNALFGRDAEHGAGGLDFWVNGFNAGTFTAATIMLNILNAAQNEDLLSVNNKLTAANLFTRTIDPELDGSNFQVTYAGDGDVIAGRNFLAFVTSNLVTVPTQGETTAYIQTNIADPGDAIGESAGWIQTELNAGIGRSLYATDTEIFAATSSGVYSTIDNGMPWFSKGPTGHDVSDVIKSHQYILAATLDGVYRSSDNGNTWLLTNGSPGISAGGGIYGPHVFAKNSAYVFIIAWARGIFRSGDDGENWEQMWVGQEGYGYQDYAAGATCICTVGEKIFIGGTSPSPIYSSSDNGNTWVGSQFPHNLQSLYNDNGKLFACGSMGVYLSTDLGNSWSTQYSNTIGQHGELIGLGTFRNIVSYNQNLIAAVDFNSIYISRDNGISWTSFNDGLISDWTFTGLAIKPPYIWALRDFFGNAYRRPLTEVR